MSNINFNIEEKLNRPVLALRGLWIYPYSVVHFDAGRKKSIDAIETALKKDSILVVFTQKDIRTEDPKAEDLYEMGTVVIVKQILKMNNGVTRVLAEGICRCKAKKIYDDGRFLRADVEEYYYNEVESEDAELLTLRNMVEGAFEDYTTKKRHLDVDTEVSVQVSLNMDKFTNNVASYIMGLSDDEHFENFKIFDMRQRLEKLYEILQNSIELSFLEEKLSRKVSSRLNKNQREYYLREQLNVIKEELGDGEDLSSELDEYANAIMSFGFDENIEEMLFKEIRKLSEIPSGSPEGNVIRNYLDKIVALPWKKSKKEKLDVNYTRKILDKEHFGLKDVKDRIVESIALRQISNNQKGSIICLVGPPGVGKTSIAKSIAKSLNREFVSMRLGGLHDESEIRGHRRTYVGAMPGKILNLLEQCKVNNPVLLLDEIDKVSNDFRGDPSSALLEVLDPEQNNKFTDNYINIPFDLSKVMFITTANTTSTIPSPLLDRMEVIPVSSYTYDEKEKIAIDHLIPKAFKNFSITKRMLDIKADAVRDMIRYYTRESGVRNLERLIEKVIRKSAVLLVSEKTKKVIVNSKNLVDFLGKKKYHDDVLEKEDKVGLVNGLAWTEVGGELLTIETDIVKGTGKIQLTGQLGDVMKESAMTAISFVRSKADKFNINEDFYKEKDIHIHVPEGAVPKDGPSAGITMTTAIVSALTNRKVNRQFAMTGEVTLRGRVLAIGGLKEKILAGNRYGIKNIIIPKENEVDIEEIPEDIRETLNIYPVSDVCEVLDLVLEKEV
ncbi:endopeptidase La [Parvimonas sp. KA00067]|uniref:endopeptidase La n=1 Tax=Parvimonas sp. KA00067 TaxID=1588755 RepID=UPI000791E7DD|nr:endopeptidase La [Parvimonas sp. KA00067]KXB65914.1 endopeptidase La [Parvimonas sp. KA00067]